MTTSTNKAERYVTAVLAVILVVMVGVLAWQLYRRFGPRPDGAADVTSPDAPVVMTGQTPWETIDEMIESPLAGTGYELVETDPGGIVPPPTAERWQCVQTVADGWLHHYAYYQMPSSPQAASEAYIEALVTAGFERANGGEDASYILFTRGGEYATLSLPNQDQNATMTQVTLTHMVPLE